MLLFLFIKRKEKISKLINIVKKFNLFERIGIEIEI